MRKRLFIVIITILLVSAIWYGWNKKSSITTVKIINKNGQEIFLGENESSQLLQLLEDKVKIKNRVKYIFGNKIELSSANQTYYYLFTDPKLIKKTEDAQIIKNDKSVYKGELALYQFLNELSEKYQIPLNVD